MGRLSEQIKGYLANRTEVQANEDENLLMTLGKNYTIIYHFDRILKECGFSDEEIETIFI